MRKTMNVCLLAPLPPEFDGRNHSCGGIGHWTQMILKYAQTCEQVSLSVIDTTPKWRLIHNFPLWKRVFSGGLNFSVYMTLLIWRLLLGKTDLIHMTTSGNLGVIRDILVILTTKLFRVPVVYHIRFGRLPALARRGGVEWMLLSSAMKLAASVISIDAATFLSIKHQHPHVNLALVPNCINFASLRDIRVGGRAARRTVLFAGWVIPTKGIEELLIAWSSLSSVDWSLVIVGPIESSYMKHLSEKYGSEGINFLGEKTHAETLSMIAACDVFVLPSYSEGFPNAVLEAMALGKPIVASSVGAIPEMLANGAGSLVPPKDAKVLQYELQRVMDDQHFRNKIGSCAKERAIQNYSIEVVFDLYVSIWRQLIPNLSVKC
jgi:glycosyltransferase involved in cell wall biosynthesis